MTCSARCGSPGPPPARAAPARAGGGGLGGRRLDEGSEFRSSTKISRHRAAAEASTLRTEEVLPPGARFEVFLRWDGASAADAAEFAALLVAWRPFIGRGISRGRGA